ncbi:thioesterase domain-containing protein [Cryptosporangium minutisporangium]|uniref:thioesterase domain-containing protein n=1 Tax=Cryptosporangium minutisporangium TaxID=113569 RepID=UPI0031F1104E
MLILIHPVGGLLDWYKPLVAGLGPNWDCYGIPRDRTCDDTAMQALARSYLARIRAAHPTGRYTLAGWCLGGPLAYEIALQAHADGEGDRIDDVILLDPPRAETPTNSHDILITHIHNACPHQTRSIVVEALAATEQLGIPERAAALVARLGLAGPGSSDYPLLGQMLMRLGDHAAMDSWRPTGQLPHLRLCLPQAVTPGSENAGESWRSHAAALTVTVVPGDHESMLTSEELHRALTAPCDSHPHQANGR